MDIDGCTYNKTCHCMHRDRGEAHRNAVKHKDRLVKDHAERGSICPCLIVNGEEALLNEGSY